MQKVRNSILFFLLLVTFTSRAQNLEVIKNYINTYKDLAIREMLRTGVPASITLAQGIHETMAGTSKLVLKSNNHFGIKCKSYWTGESVSYDDDAKDECFRKYPSAEESYQDHSNFLKNSGRYAALFTLDPVDYEGWANGLKKAGYATNPKYPQALIKLIEDYHLQDYTLIALGKMPVEDESLATTQKPLSEKETMAVVAVMRPDKQPEKEISTPEKIVARSVYPEGVFKINETKVVYVKKETPFLAIAKQYDIDLAKLFEFNEITRAEEVNNDQLIYLQRKRKTGNNKFHLILSGETLHGIAQQEAIRLESLMELNWLKDDEMPAAGEQLSLTKKSPVIPKLAAKENYSIIPGSKMRPAN